MKRFLFVAACAAAVCGCTPTAVTTATVESVTHISKCVDGEVTLYSVGAEQRALLRDEFETWRRAGLDGFEASFVTYAPTVNISGTTADGNSYLVDLGADTVVVNETDGMGESSQYVREATAADKRFRVFLLAYIADGKFPKAEETK